MKTEESIRGNDEIEILIKNREIELSEKDLKEDFWKFEEMRFDKNLRKTGKRKWSVVFKVRLEVFPSINILSILSVRRIFGVPENKKIQQGKYIHPDSGLSE